MGWVTSHGALVGTNALDPWKAWIETNLMMVLWCTTMRSNHYLMGWGGWLWKPWMVLYWCFYEIPHSCFEYGMGDNGLREIWLNHSTVGWNVEVPFGFGFCIINMRLFLYVFLWVLYWFICGLYGCDFLGIFVAIMLVMYMFYESNYVWLSSCFYL